MPVEHRIGLPCFSPAFGTVDDTYAMIVEAFYNINIAVLFAYRNPRFTLLYWLLRGSLARPSIADTLHLSFNTVDTMKPTNSRLFCAR